MTRARKNPQVFVGWISPTTSSFDRRPMAGGAHPTSTHPTFMVSRLPKAQRGVALIGAIFVVVILAMLGIYMVTLSGVEQATTSQAVIASRVYYGAKAGLEWGIHQAIGPTVSVCNSSTPLAPIAGLGDIGVTVICVCTYPAACVSGATSVFYLKSTATYGTYGNADYSQRILEATVTGIP